MNLKELNDKVHELTEKVVNEQKLDYEKVTIQYSKVRHTHMLFAMNGDEIISYIEWV